MGPTTTPRGQRWKLVKQMMTVAPVVSAALPLISLYLEMDSRLSVGATLESMGTARETQMEWMLAPFYYFHSTRGGVAIEIPQIAGDTLSVQVSQNVELTDKPNGHIIKAVGE